MSSAGYAAPRSLDEAVALLAQNPGARVLAGGGQLLVEPGRHAIAGSLLVDLGRIEGLAGIEQAKDGSLRIGAMTTLASLAASGPVAAAYPALVEAARSTGDAQARNRASVAGSIVSGDPDAQLPALAMALGAALHVQGPKGTRTIPVDDGPPRHPLGAGEVIVAVSIPAAGQRGGVGCAAVRNPATLGAVCCVAASVTLDGAGAVANCRVALTGATSRLERLTAVEQAMAGHTPDAEAIAAAAAAAGKGLTFRDDLFGSGGYRAHLARVLTARALRQAVERSGR
jgi:carbon-monoxide dehydrogenase medium subunit